MLWVLKRIVSMRWFFWAPKTYVKIDGQENIYNLRVKNCVYLNLRLVQIWSVSFEIIYLYIGSSKLKDLNETSKFS